MSSNIGVIAAQRNVLAGDRRGAIPQTPPQSRRRAASMRSAVVATDRPRALEAAHYAGITVNRLITVKERTLGVSAGGRLVITLAQVHTRLREMLLMEIGQDVSDLPEDGYFSSSLNPTTRMELQLPIQSTYFCEVKCRVGVKALRDANTPEKLAKAIWSAIPLAHRASTAVAEESAESFAA
ncbi:hypothetical protein [Verrucomicrobium sp. BvORR034]|uniref:hypothetical protein n=1 Tax=Verrucomicrobium sp. BvORR034 TaxID=1396418 RepID=UPI0006786853|nr:hypothetical protein [Verrucomicrobium sp. BvORR034]